MRGAVGLLALLIGCGGPVVAPEPPLPDHAARATQPLDRVHPEFWGSNRYALSLDARADLAGRRATITWTLNVRALKRDLGVDLYLDLPPDVAIDQILLDVQQGTLSEGRAAPSISAQRVYERVTAQRIDPALLEQVDDRRYRLRVYPLLRPRVVRLRYHTLLPATADGVLLQIPRPFIAGEPEATPSAVRVEVRDAAGEVHVTDQLTLRLPYAGPRAESVADGDGRISQWQLVPPPEPAAGAAPRVIDALDDGVDASGPDPMPIDARVQVIGRPQIEVLRDRGRGKEVGPGAAGSSKSTMTTTRRPLRGAPDLVALINAAVLQARAQSAPILLTTSGHDRWHTVEQLRSAIPDDVQMHVRATPGANLGVLAALADAGRGHLIVDKPAPLGEPLITDLRVEVLFGQASWMPLPKVHVAGTPIVLTARHTGPMRARLHGMMGRQPFVVDLPTASDPAGDGLAAIWHRHALDAGWGRLTAKAHELASKAHGLVTRSVSLAVFEREEDYVAAQTPDPTGAPAPASRVVVTDSRIQIVSKVFFATGSAQVSPLSFPLIDEIARLSLDQPTLSYAIIGHTDDRERPPIPLGLRRAIAVRAALLERGVSGRRMTVLTQGDRQPIRRNESADDRAHNRRVEFQIIALNGKMHAPPGLSPPTLSKADRRRFAAALVAQRGGEVAGASLETLRALLTDEERIAWLLWLYQPAEYDGVIDALTLDGQPDWARQVVVRLLAERSDWARLARHARGNLELLDAAQRATFVARSKAPVIDLCADGWGPCTAVIDAIAAIDPQRARQIADLAMRWEPRPSLATLLRAEPGVARAAGLSRHLSQISTTASDFKRVAEWAQALQMPAFRCRVLRRISTLSPAAGGVAVQDPECPGLVSPR